MSIKNGFVNIPSLSVTQEELERVAEEIGVKPEYLTAAVSYGDLLRREAAERQLDPSQMMSARFPETSCRAWMSSHDTSAPVSTF